LVVGGCWQVASNIVVILLFRLARTRKILTLLGVVVIESTINHQTHIHRISCKTEQRLKEGRY